ncbi:MAG TPA: hypothetical protein VNA12_00370, partial [Mycobacteriales bacterium]|nr:hypothetical protein [Mycobacteriales bacterium]
MRRRRAHRAAALAAIALSIAACGTRVPSGPAGAVRAPDGSALTAPELGAPLAGSTDGDPGAPLGAAGPASGGSTLGGSGTFTPGTTGSGSGSGSTGSGSGSGSGSAGGGSRPGGSSAIGPGITATKIYVGAPWNSDANAGNAGFGIAADSGDERDDWAAILDDLNKRGGILGRKMEVIFAEYRAATNEPVESQQQAACDKWTKDNKVFAVYGGGSDILLE